MLNLAFHPGDRGSNITVVGLIANLVLCGTKGLAGVWLHSASLLADAAHSLSDTFSDLVTLFCWKMSQKPASVTHPMGYGKFETMGGLGVSVVLVAGSFAIGMHSYSLLLDVLQPALENAPSGLRALSSITGDWAKLAGGLMHDHHNAAGAAVEAGEAAKAHLGHDHSNALDPNAMWFALISILVKEWLYRATLKIAKEENSSVLEANAIHHRSDSLSSGVTFLAIGGSYLGFPVLDPLGGLLVAGLIGKQGAELLIGALQDLSDRGVQPEVLEGFENALKEVMAETESNAGNTDATRLTGWTDLRAVRSGVSSFVDVTLVMSEETKLKDARMVESKVREKIMASHKGVRREVAFKESIR
jgi:divalent metal cation (Fe/Co/Zn/Cd) transporter